MRPTHALHVRPPQLLPASRPGRAAVGALLAFAALAGALLALVAAGQRGGETLSSNPLLAAVGLGAAAAGSVAAAAATWAVLRRRDRAVLVVLALVVGWLVVLWVAGEAVAPH